MNALHVRAALTAALQGLEIFDSLSQRSAQAGTKKAVDRTTPELSNAERAGTDRHAEEVKSLSAGRL